MNIFIEQFKEVIGNFKKAKYFNNKITGISSGIKDLDFLIGGFHPQEFTIIAARQGNGLQAFVTSLISHQLINEKRKILLFSTVDSYHTAISRLISNISEIELYQLNKGEFSDEKLSHFETNFEEKHADNLYVYDDFPLNIENLFEKISILSQDGFKPDIIYLNALNYLTIDNKFENYQNQLIIADLIKKKAHELEIPIIGTYNMVYEFDDFPEKRPTLFDLRKYSPYERKAGHIIFLHRPVYYDGTRENENGENTINKIELILEKNPSGSVGIAMMEYLHKICKVKQI